MEEQQGSGRTTRLVDKYIQEYFTKPLYTPIVIKDHVDKYENNFELLRKVLKRLKREFGEVPYSDNKAVLYVNPYTARFGLTSSGENTHCVIVREKDRFQDTREAEFRCYKDRLEELSIQFGDKEDEIVRRKPPIFDVLFTSRATGISTRQADDYVQQFFALKPGQYIEIHDHYGEGRANMELAKKVCRRLEEEHNEKFYLHRGTIPRIIRVEK